MAGIGEGTKRVSRKNSRRGPRRKEDTPKKRRQAQASRQGDDLLLGQEEDLLRGQEEDLLLGQEEDLLGLFLARALAKWGPWDIEASPPLFLTPTPQVSGLPVAEICGGMGL